MTFDENDPGTDPRQEENGSESTTGSIESGYDYNDGTQSYADNTTGGEDTGGATSGIGDAAEIGPAENAVPLRGANPIRFAGSKFSLLARRKLIVVGALVIGLGALAVTWLPDTIGTSKFESATRDSAETMYSDDDAYDDRYVDDDAHADAEASDGAYGDEAEHGGRADETLDSETAKPKALTQETVAPRSVGPPTVALETAKPKTATPRAITPAPAPPKTVTPKTAAPKRKLPGPAALTPSGRKAHDSVAGALRQSGRTGAADRYLARSLRALEEGEFATSVRAGATAWNLDSTDPRIANHMAAVHLQLGDWKSAEAWSRRALAIDIEFSRAWTNLGVALLRQGFPEAAERIHQNAVDVDPNDWKAIAGLAAARRALNNYDGAIDAYQRALIIAPDKAELRYNLALTLKAAGRIAEAKEEFGRYLRLSDGSDPDRDAKVRDWLGR